MPNQTNLTPFKPGQSGNPGGRPKSSAELREVIRTAFSEPLQGTEKTKLDSIVEKLIATALKGNTKAVEILFGYAYGKPKPEDNQIPYCTVIMPKPPGQKNGDDD